MSQLKRYQDPELYERLAAEYVLGTLRGPALRRFERLIQERPYIRYAVELWEARLNVMAESATEIKPDPKVWTAIQSDLKLHGRPTTSNRSAHFWSRVWDAKSFWQSATAVLAVLLIVNWLLPKAQIPGTPGSGFAMPSYVAVLESDKNKPMMVTLGDQQHRTIMVRVLDKPKMPKEQQLALWALRDANSPPVLIGVVPYDTEQRALKLSREEWRRIKGAKEFAVTMEPMGKSDMDKPSGPVMFKGACLDFI